MNENDLIFFVAVLAENRHKQSPLAPAPGERAAAERLEAAGLLISHGAFYIPTPLGQAKIVRLIETLRSGGSR